MNLIDTHAHLYLDAFDNDREQMIKRATNAGVKLFYQPSISRQHFASMEQLEAEYPENIRLMIGLHPCQVSPDTYNAELDFIKMQIDKRDFIAVGEIGIDLHWNPSTLKIQQEVFRKQISWALEKHLPINIHSRDAFEETLSVVEEFKGENLQGIFHCFSGTETQAERVINCGMMLGIGGIVTFKNGKIDRFLDQIPLKHIVLETDAPYLAPTPFRGKRNESSYLIQIAEKLSEIHHKEIEEIARITTQNTLSIHSQQYKN